MSRAPTIILANMLLALCGFGGLAACGSSDASPTERLWISGVPSKATEPMSAFVTTRTGEGKYIGAFFQGSAYRGTHDVFEWRSDGKDAAKLKFLQDGSSMRVRFGSCEPKRGFDFCLSVKGDKGGEQRYYSRKRWNVRRPGKKKELLAIDVPNVIAELAEDDEELQVALELPAADAP